MEDLVLCFRAFCSPQHFLRLFETRFRMVIDTYGIRVFTTFLKSLTYKDFVGEEGELLDWKIEVILLKLSDSNPTVKEELGEILSRSKASSSRTIEKSYVALLCLKYC